MNSSRLALPTFFNYSEEKTDNGYETMQDFFLSWIFRCSDEKFKVANERVQQYSKLAVFYLLHGYNNTDDHYIIDMEMPQDFKVVNVKTKRQHKRIDLIVELKIEENGVLTNYVLNIENKWYTSIRNGQIEHARNIINQEYSNKDFSIKNFVIFCDQEIIRKDDIQKLCCRNNEYKFLSICDIQSYTKMVKGMETKNDLFDEYWFRL